MVVEADRLHVVPEGLDPVVAALAEPLAVAVHATRRAGVGNGDTVVIMGAGPIGLLLAFAVRRAGAGKILIGEPAPARRTFAASVGFDTLDAADPVGDLERRTSGWLADVAFDAAAAPAVAAILPRLVRPAGRIALVGTYGRPTEVDLQAILFKELTLLGNRVYQPADIDAGLEMLAADPAVFRPLISDVVGLDEAPAAFARLRAGEGVKYLVATGWRDAGPRQDASRRGPPRVAGTAGTRAGGGLGLDQGPLRRHLRDRFAHRPGRVPVLAARHARPRIRRDRRRAR